MKRRPIHESPTEKIEFVHSIFIVVYWFTPTTYEWEPHFRHVIRKRPYNSNQRTASPMVYSRLGDAERTCRDLNGKYNTDRFQVQRVYRLCTPHYEPWRVLAITKRKKLALRQKQRRHEEALVRKAKKKVVLEKEVSAYRAVGDYASVEHLMKPKFFDFIKHRKRKHEDD